MLVENQIIDVKLSKKNLEWYNSKGYNGKLQDIIKVKAEDLILGTTTEILVICDYCLIEGITKIFNKRFIDYIGDLNGKYVQKNACENCKQKRTQETNLLKYGQISHMKTEKYRKIFSKEYKEIFDSFKLRGCTLISPTYVYCEDDLEFICNKHIEKGIQITSWTQFNRGFGCNYCSYELKGENMRGSNHPNWNGGSSSLNQYLRNFIADWKQNTLKLYKYKCCLTNGLDLKIHHLYGMNIIIKETLNELKLDLKESVNLYSDEDLSQIVLLIIQKHEFYGLGVLLNSKIHRLFHSLYLNKDNTPEQFEEFKIRLKLGEFDDFLKENNLCLVI
jgi:hypothetical protein